MPKKNIQYFIPKLPRLVFRLVPPGRIQVEDGEHWSGPADLVVLRVEEGKTDEEVYRTKFENFSKASEFLGKLLIGDRKRLSNTSD